MDLTFKKKLLYYGGNYSTYVRTKAENETNQMKAYAKQQEEIAHIKKFMYVTFCCVCVLFVLSTLNAERGCVNRQCFRWYLCKLGQAGQVQAEG